MPKLAKPRVRGIEDLRPKSDERRAEKVTRGRAEAPIAYFPTDLPIPYRPVPRAWPFWATDEPGNELAGKAVGT